MKWYDLVSLGGLVISVTGAVVFLSIPPFENSPALLILLFGIVVMTYGYALRFFFWVQKRGKYIRP